MLTSSPYGTGTSGPSDDLESPPLPFESEFDGIRRKLAAPEPPMLDPSRYWDLHGGTD